MIPTLAPSEIAVVYEASRRRHKKSRLCDIVEEAKRRQSIVQDHSAIKFDELADVTEETASKISGEGLSHEEDRPDGIMRRKSKTMLKRLESPTHDYEVGPKEEPAADDGPPRRSA